MLDMQDSECPCCGEVIGLELDASAGSGRYIEDCHVCRRPIMALLQVDAGGGIQVQVRSQDEAWGGAAGRRVHGRTAAADVVRRWARKAVRHDGHRGTSPCARPTWK